LPESDLPRRGRCAHSGCRSAQDAPVHATDLRPSGTVRLRTRRAPTRPTGIATRDLDVGDPNRDLYAFLDQVYNSIDEQHVCADLRMAPQEVEHDRGTIAAAEQCRSGDRKLAFRLNAAGDESVWQTTRHREPKQCRNRRQRAEKGRSTPATWRPYSTNAIVLIHSTRTDIRGSVPCQNI
jgi:hypothetical protein